MALGEEESAACEFCCERPTTSVLCHPRDIPQ